MNKTIVWIVVIVVVILGAWFLMRDKAAVAAPVTAQDVEWNFTEAGTDEDTQAPLTKVTVTVRGTAYDAGTYIGSCAVVDETSSDLVEGEVGAAMCWFAGGGKEIGVFNEGGKAIVKVGDVDEGTPEEGGFRGNFTTLIEL